VSATQRFRVSVAVARLEWRTTLARGRRGNNVRGSASLWLPGPWQRLRVSVAVAGDSGPGYDSGEPATLLFQRRKASSDVA
jgi:hypothetical protein